MASEVRALFHKLGQYKHYFWPTIGVLAVIFCGWLLYKELRGLTFSSLLESFAAIPVSGWLLAVAATLVGGEVLYRAHA